MSIKISLAIACVISLLWIEFADRYLGNRTKIILIIISSVLALISYIKNMHEPLVIFAMIMIINQHTIISNSKYTPFIKQLINV